MYFCQNSFKSLTLSHRRKEHVLSQREELIYAKEADLRRDQTLINMMKK